LGQAAARAACVAYERARVQQNQIARLRRRGAGARQLARIPFVFASALDLASVLEISIQLERKLS